MTKTKYLKSGTRRRTKKNKTKRGGMMKSMNSLSKAVKHMFVEKPLTAEQQDLFDKMLSTERDDSYRIQEVLKDALKELIDIFETSSKTNKVNLIKSSEIIQTLTKDSGHHDKQLIKKFIQIPNIVGILTPHLEKVNYYTDLSESIVRMSRELRNELLNTLYTALENGNKLNLIVNNEKIKTLGQTSLLGDIKNNKDLIIVLFKKGNQYDDGIHQKSRTKMQQLRDDYYLILTNMSDIYNELKEIIISSDKYEELKKILETRKIFDDMTDAMENDLEFLGEIIDKLIIKIKSSNENVNKVNAAVALVESYRRDLKTDLNIYRLIQIIDNKFINEILYDLLYVHPPPVNNIEPVM